MAAFPEFCGGTYQALAPYEGADEAVNLFVETREVPGSAKQVTLYGRPGMPLETTLGTVACRGWFSQDGQSWTVYGATLYERTGTATFVSRGTIVNDGFPVSFASNGDGGDQLAIVGGGQLKVLDLLTNTLSAAISLPFSNPVMIVFQDGYGLINEADTPTVWFSALEDFETWDALDFYARSTSSDDIVALAQSRDRVHALGSKTSTQYYDSGDADTPWLPYPGTTVQIGIITPWALTVYGDEIRFLGRSPRGMPRIVQITSDGSVTTLSTPPIEEFLEECTTLDDAEALTYEQEGHTFTAFTCPSSPADLQTIVYDDKEHIWGKWAGWDSTEGQYTRWRARGSVAIGNDVFVGDYATGAVYTLDLGTYTDNGAVLMRERIAPYLGTSPQWSFLHQVQLLAQAGVGLSSGQGSDPQVELLLSRDGAKTWVSAGLASLGALGEYTTRTIWRRLGRARQDLLVLRVRQSDPVQTVWTGLDLTFENGTGQL